ncbi:threonylcarbamoyl-AMP synthase [Oscillochloris sp. ZM17-4]|uniref:L-threonylcarbamoyladenylate synthase n=1 Tax=Oscillochloris sp. ZM17-4 TaxID=2866714 RepID=UPI001C738136|nr:L-threonylcarbamoyladenylate synthase [Oscillochloris sp. ZM17-4]MBX0326413.1 threonylcarbamoyl-AMP synthase [Oscillochloris sp. ZM17-4]
MTKVLPADAAGIREAAATLAAGGLVAFPTETVYGLGGDALSTAAVARIFAAKGRPAEDPLIVHLADLADLPRVTGALSPQAALLAGRLWPGPLTLVLPRGPAVPHSVTAGRETVAVRLPAHPVARALIAAAGTPVAAPSANRFGHTSPTSAAHVLADLGGRIDLVLDGGPATIGVESTVLDLSGPVPTLLRPGGVSLETLRELLGEVALGGRAAEAGGQIAPGLLDRHYAPESALHLCVGAPAACRGWIRAQAARQIAAGRRVGLLVPDEDAALLAGLAADIEPLGPAGDPAAIAGRLYAALRALDARRPDVILARDIGDVGIARAILDRLTRAAAGRVSILTPSERRATQ